LPDLKQSQPESPKGGLELRDITQARQSHASGVDGLFLLERNMKPKPTIDHNAAGEEVKRLLAEDASANESHGRQTHLSGAEPLLAGECS
jgi:hypothetical protein